MFTIGSCATKKLGYSLISNEKLKKFCFSWSLENSLNLFFSILGLSANNAYAAI